MYLWLAMVGILVFTASSVVVLGLTVDDWGRDLSTNHAETDEKHVDPRLRPLHFTDGVETVADRVARIAESLPRWRLIERHAEGDVAQLQFTRTTPLFRFVDDISVRVEPEGNGSVVRVSSRSRVGKGDLGQNPRNLRELLDKLRSTRP